MRKVGLAPRCSNFLMSIPASVVPHARPLPYLFARHFWYIFLDNSRYQPTRNFTSWLFFVYDFSIQWAIKTIAMTEFLRIFVIYGPDHTPVILVDVSTSSVSMIFCVVRDRGDGKRPDGVTTFLFRNGRSLCWGAGMTLPVWAQRNRDGVQTGKRQAT